VRQHAVERARRARWQVLVVAPLIATVVLAYSYREELFGLDLPVRVAAVLALMVLGWTLARDLGRAVGPTLILSAAVVPLREPSGVDVRARLGSDVKPSQVQRMLAESVRVPTRSDPHIALEEVDGEDVVMRVSAVPVNAAEGAELADEVLAALQRVSRDIAAVPAALR
jgi:hypothetical protein